MTSSDRLSATAVVTLAPGAPIVLPLLTMGMGFGGMMEYGGTIGGYGTAGGWWPVVGTAVRTGSLLLLLGGGYLVFRRVTASPSSRDPAMEEPRLADARGDRTEGEFQARRTELERPE